MQRLSTDVVNTSLHCNHSLEGIREETGQNEGGNKER